MGVVTKEFEITSPIPPAKMFKAFLLDGHINMPKILPQAIKSIETIEGDGGPESIIKTTFADGLEYKYVKQKIEVVDKENFVYNYSTIEGDPWMEGLEMISYENKLESSEDGGSKCKAITKYYSKGEAILDMDKLKAGEEKAMAMFRIVESHILANPNAY